MTTRSETYTAEFAALQEEARERASLTKDFDASEKDKVLDLIGDVLCQPIERSELTAKEEAAPLAFLEIVKERIDALEDSPEQKLASRTIGMAALWVREKVLRESEE